jgi:hypothetical protein
VATFWIFVSRTCLFLVQGYEGVCHPVFQHQISFTNPKAILKNIRDILNGLHQQRALTLLLADCLAHK